MVKMRGYGPLSRSRFHTGPSIQRGFGAKSRYLQHLKFKIPAFQRGNGIGSMFKGLLRFFAPRIWKVGKQVIKSGSKRKAKEILKSAAKDTLREVGKKALKAGAEIAAESVDGLVDDIKSGENAKKAFHKQALEIKKKIDDRVSNLGKNKRKFSSQDESDLQKLVNKVPPAAATAVISAATGTSSETLTPPPPAKKKKKERTKTSIWDLMRQ